MLDLRDYQKRGLAALTTYLSEARERGPSAPFIEATGRAYHAVPQLPEQPYICLRIPTGGGKTLMAAHIVGLATDTYRKTERSICLWLVPSTTIRDQTLSRLRTTGDPYREALEARCTAPVVVMDLQEALSVNRATLATKTCVIVATFAALRVEDTEGRKVYGESGRLNHHFSGVPADLLATAERNEHGAVIPSLANLLRLHRPIVIVDEAHKARTALSFDTLARVSPSCIIELTATPRREQRTRAGIVGSNVLFSVGAAELKTDGMVKLPIVLRTRPAWTDAVGDALERQRALEQAARQERDVTGEYIRPIILFQAQPRSAAGDTVTVDVLLRALVEDFRVPRDQIAIATGEQDELDGVDLGGDICTVRCIITVEKLREGWDCPYAYILCTVSEVGAEGAVEQILGRVLRMPRAKRKEHAELNKAYAYVASPRFLAAAARLRDALVEASGFAKWEAGEALEADEAEQLTLRDEATSTVRPPEPPTGLETLPAAVRDVVTWNPDTGELVATGELTDEGAEALQQCFVTDAGRQAVVELRDSSQWRAQHQEVQRVNGGPFSLPRLGVEVDRQIRLFSGEVLDDLEITLAGCDPAVSVEDWTPPVAAGDALAIDVDQRGGIAVGAVPDDTPQILLLERETGWTAVSLARWLDERIPHADLRQVEAYDFIRRGVDGLLERAGTSLELLVRHKFALKQVFAQKLDACRQRQRGQAFQAALFGPGRLNPRTSADLALTLASADQYTPGSRYTGPYTFRKHVFGVVGELDTGPEVECAMFLDMHPMVKRWIRNLAMRRDTSFWLQTTTDKFYPDFVGELVDGRKFAVEYKNERDYTNADSQEKRRLGELWEDTSAGTCLFIMTNGSSWNAIDAKFRA